eukprot:5443645-Pleurochrysis_carterae.AAC.1
MKYVACLALCIAWTIGSSWERAPPYGSSAGSSNDATHRKPLLRNCYKQSSDLGHGAIHRYRFEHTCTLNELASCTLFKTAVASEKTGEQAAQRPAAGPCAEIQSSRSAGKRNNDVRAQPNIYSVFSKAAHEDSVLRALFHPKAAALERADGNNIKGATDFRDISSQAAPLRCVLTPTVFPGKGFPLYHSC